MKKLLKLESLREAIKGFLLDGQGYDTGKGLRQAFIVDQNGNVELSYILSSSTFMRNDYDVLTYIDILDVWAEEDLNLWLANEIGAEITKEEMELILKNQIEIGEIDEDELKEIREDEYSLEVLSEFNVGVNFFESDFMEDKQEYLKKYWYENFLEERFVENFLEYILSQLENEWEVI